MKKNYELMFIVPANDNNETSAKAVVAEIKAELEKKWWKITYDEFWWIRKLAYKIKHNTEWFYQVFNLEIEWKEIANIETSFNINNNVIRYLFTTIEDEDYKPYTHDQLKESEEARIKAKEDKKRKQAPKKDSKKNNKEYKKVDEKSKKDENNEK